MIHIARTYSGFKLVPEQYATIEKKDDIEILEQHRFKEFLSTS